MIQFPKKLIAATLFLFLAVGSSLSQTVGEAERLEHLADQLVNNQHVDSAVTYYEDAADIYQVNSKAQSQLRCLNKAAKTLLALNRLPDADAFIKKAIAVCKKRDVGSSADEIQTYSLAGETFKHLAQLDSSVLYHQKAANLSIKVYGPDSQEAANCYIDLSNTFRFTTEFNKSIDYAKKALRILESLKTKPIEVLRKIHVCHNTMGLVYWSMSEFEKALKENELALLALTIRHPDITLLDLIQHETPLDNDYQIANGINNRGLIYLKLGKDTLALTCFEKALKIYQKQRPDNYAILMFYRNIGDVYAYRDDFGAAMKSYLQAAKTAESLFPPQHPAIAACYDDLVALNFRKGNYKDALRYASIGLRANGVFTSDIQSGTYNFRNALDLQQVVVSLNYIGRILEKRAEETSDLSFLKASLKTFVLSDSLTIQARKSNNSQADKLHLNRKALEAHEDAIGVSLKLYASTHRLEYLESAFRFSESNKAAILTDVLSELNAKNMGSIPTHLLEFEEKLSHDRMDLTASIQKEEEEAITDTDKISRLKDELFRINVRYDSIMKMLERSYPKFYNVKFNNTLSTIADVQQSLDEQSAWIEYFIGPERIFVFAITTKKAHCIEIKGHSSISEQIIQLRESLSPIGSSTNPMERFNNYVTNAANLFDNFVSDVIPYIKEKKRLTIVPDAELGYIPFEVLLTKIVSSPQTTFKTLPYLCNDYAISYSYSATVSLTRPKQVSSHDTKLLAFAPSYNHVKREFITDQRVRSRLSTLEWNKYEVQEVLNQIRGRSFLDSMATEQNFKQLANNYDVLHLAMHAIVNDEDPLYSKLAFYQTQDSQEDGLLNAYELYAIKLTASMVVLSACETGFGKLERGEGIMSLAHAFTYAGCPSVVVSHWLADDKATAQLMKLFYKYLAEGESKDIALQKAKIAFLDQADEINQNPAFWSAFVIWGDTSPIVENSWINRYAYLIGLFFIMATVCFFVIRRRGRTTRSLN